MRLFSEISKVFKENNFSRLPVYIDDIDHIVGLIHHRDFEAARDRNLKSLRTILKPVPTVSPDTKISKLLRILQKNKTRIWRLLLMSSEEQRELLRLKIFWKSLLAKSGMSMMRFR